MAWREDARFGDVDIGGTLTLSSSSVIATMLEAEELTLGDDADSTLIIEDESEGTMEYEGLNVEFVNAQEGGLMDIEMDLVSLTGGLAGSKFDSEMDDNVFTGAAEGSIFDSEQDVVTFSSALEASVFDCEQDVITLGVDPGSTLDITCEAITLSQPVALDNQSDEALCGGTSQEGQGVLWLDNDNTIKVHEGAEG